MIPKSGNRFSDTIMLKKESMIPKSGNRFSDKIMLKQNVRDTPRFNRKHDALERD